MNETLKKALISILIGAAIAFVTALLQGLLGYFQGLGGTVGGVGGGIVYFLKALNNDKLA